MISNIRNIINSLLYKKESKQQLNITYPDNCFNIKKDLDECLLKNKNNCENIKLIYLNCTKKK